MKHWVVSRAENVNRKEVDSVLNRVAVMPLDIALLAFHAELWDWTPLALRTRDITTRAFGIIKDSVG